MSSDSLAQQLNFESDAESPFKRSCREKTPSPDERLGFGSPDEKSRVGRLNFGSSDEGSPAGRLNFGSPVISPAVSPDESSSGEESTSFVVNPETPPPPVPEHQEKDGDIKLAVPVSQFLSSLCKRRVLSPLPNGMTAFSSPSTPPVGFGSFTTAFQSPTNPNSVIKISDLGTNGKNRNGDSPKIDNKGLLELLIAFNKCLDDPNCAKVSAVKMYQAHDGFWRMCVEQEKCSPLTCDDAKTILECFIALLQKFFPTGIYPKDFKVSNFGKNASGRVVWFDCDFGTVNKKKPVPSIVSSGDFQFDGNEQFQRLLLALIELFYPPITSFFRDPLIKDRKDVFRVLNQQKGLLKSFKLLSSEMSISETTIQDFGEVLGNIGLSEENIAYLVGLLTPPSSQ